jgi:hypothetical protein
MSPVQMAPVQTSAGRNAADNLDPSLALVGDQVDVLPPDQAVLLSWRAARDAFMQPNSTRQTLEMLNEFESQVHWVAQQAHHLRNT